VKSNGGNIDVEIDALTGRTSDILVESIKYSDVKEKVVVIQIGVVDCAPRILGPFGRRVIGRLRPKSVRVFVRNCLRSLHRRWFFVMFGHRVLVRPKNFERNLRTIVASLKEKNPTAVALVTILPTTLQHDRVYVGFSDNIRKYNAIIRRIAFEEGVILCDLNAVVQDSPEFIYDGVHMSLPGKRIAADEVERALCDVLRSVERV
jgi:hypothetical protein